jgi:hypothetical protein
MSATLSLEVSDLQKAFSLKDIPTTATVGELISAAIPRMNLPSRDDSGSPVCYRARHEREGRHLNDSEIVGDALKNDDRIFVEPNIEAGK